jgi:hypothetical protein
MLSSWHILDHLPREGNPKVLEIHEKGQAIEVGIGNVAKSYT